jgi:hypothetical protein
VTAITPPPAWVRLRVAVGDVPSGSTADTIAATTAGTTGAIGVTTGATTGATGTESSALLSMRARTATAVRALCVYGTSGAARALSACRSRFSGIVI